MWRYELKQVITRVSVNMAVPGWGYGLCDVVQCGLSKPWTMPTMAIATAGLKL